MISNRVRNENKFPTFNSNNNDNGNDNDNDNHNDNNCDNINKKDADVDHHKTNQWLKSSGLKAETKEFIIAAQDQSLATRSYHTTIIKDGTSPLCRMCNKYDKQLTTCILCLGDVNLRKQNIFTDTIKQPRIYKHWTVCHNHNIKTSEKWYSHEPKTVTENEDVTILWDMPIHTDRKITANRPDIVIKDHKKENL